MTALSQHESHRLHVRTGIDAESIADVEHNLQRYGERYTDRLFTAHELDCCSGTPAQAAPGLAARFAAKEAVLKILRPSEVVPDWRSIEIRRSPEGWCAVALSGSAAELAAQAGLSDFDVSLSHGAGVGTASVVAIAS